jgi:hypothetical protein
VPYAHVVFTLPQALAPLALQNPRVVYDLLLRTAAQTLQQIAHNPRHLGARLGFFAILHTWGQTLVHHPHVHCVVPAGGLAEDGRSWKPCRPGFFLPVRVLSRLFRGKFLAGLAEAFREGRLEFHGRLAPYRNSAAFNRLLHEACRTDWVVYAKPPFDRPEHVLEYLARYTHRVALSNHRLLHVDDQGVTFRFKDYRSCRARSLTLSLQEFVRRFLLHVLPRGFVRIRYYGFLANGSRARLLSCCRGALGLADVSADPPPEHAEDGEGFNALLDLLPRDLRLCPQCSEGLLRCVQILERPPPLAADLVVSQPEAWPLPRGRCTRLCLPLRSLPVAVAPPSDPALTLANRFHCPAVTLATGTPTTTGRSLQLHSPTHRVAAQLN